MRIERTEDLKGKRVSIVLDIREPGRGTSQTTYEGTVSGVDLDGRFLFLVNADIVGLTRKSGMVIGVDLLNPNLSRLVVLDP